MLDLGTGPFALLALQAARCGAKKVYAIEADPLSAMKAREAVSAAGFADVVEVIEGISTQVTLPIKVDVLISETVGSIASEEGLYAAMADAHARFVARPTEQESWIPHRCQTLGAPCSYAMHHGLGHPSFHFMSWRPGVDGPPRPECDDETLWLLASRGCSRMCVSPTRPTYSQAHTSSRRRPWSSASMPQGSPRPKQSPRRALPPRARRRRRRGVCADRRAQLSGVAMWPRLELDAEIVVDARGPGGEHAESSWPLLVPLVGDRPVAVAPSAALTVSLGVELSDNVEVPPRYSLNAAMTPSGTGNAEKGEDEAPLVPPSFELLHRLSAPLRRLRIRAELTRVDAASESAETSEERAALRRRAWWRHRGKKRRPPVIRREMPPRDSHSD